MCAMNRVLFESAEPTLTCMFVVKYHQKYLLYLRDRICKRDIITQMSRDIRFILNITTTTTTTTNFFI